MNDIRRTILWVIFGFSLVMLWDQWQLHNGRPATFFPVPTASSAASAASAPANGVPNAAATAATVPGAGAPAIAAKPRELIEVTTDQVRATFDSEGASLVRVELLKYEDEHNPGKPVVLLDQSKDRFYVAQSGLVGNAGVAWPTHKTPMNLRDGPRKLAEGQESLQLVFESVPQDGVQLIKTYTFTRGSYAVAVKHEVVNQSNQTLEPQLYVQLVRDGNKPQGESSFYSTFTGPAVFTEAKKYQKVEFADAKKGKAEFEKSTTSGYVAMVQHYFASAWLLPDGLKRDIAVEAVDLGQPLADCCYRATQLAPLGAVAPGQRQNVKATLFVGPQEEKELEAIFPGLELVKDYGWLTILAKPLYWLLHQLNEWLNNWGWAIVALVVLLKAAFYWLNAQAYRSMAKMKAINPRIMEMRERLKDNPQQMQVEMMKIYREEKVNPMGGCLPIAVQIPVFIALYWVLLSSVEIRNAPWLGWVQDLAAPDPYFILPLLMTASTMLQTWLNPTPPDPVQAKLMWIMPLAFSVMFFFFPAGLVLYWLTNNILSIAQQWMINKQLGVIH